MFERHNNLQGSQIINYKVSKDQKWCVLIGISQKEGRVAGAMQLYSVDAKKDQFIEGHAASFVTYQVFFSFLFFAFLSLFLLFFFFFFPPTHPLP